MPLLKLFTSKAYMAVYLLVLMWQLTGCYDHAHATYISTGCLPGRDIVLQSHFMIWDLYTDEQDAQLK